MACVAAGALAATAAVAPDLSTATAELRDGGSTVASSAVSPMDTAGGGCELSLARSCATNDRERSSALPALPAATRTDSPKTTAASTVRGAGGERVPGTTATADAAAAAAATVG